MSKQVEASQQPAAVGRTIVVPLDGSETAERALPYARALAGRVGGGLLLVSVVDVPAEFSAWVTTSAGSALDGWIEERRAYLQRVAAGLAELAVETRVELGSGALGIADAVRSASNPVLVMASHGRTGVRRLVLGSVASRVLGEVECPVLLLHAAGDASAGPVAPAFDKLLVPLDGSAFSEAVLDRALAVFGAGLDLHVVRVVDTPGLDLMGSPEPDIALDYGLVGEYVEAVRQEAQAYLARITEDLTRRGYRVTTAIRDGDVADEINAAAEEAKAGVIAMATHGRGGVSRLIMGSVAERVLHGATRPLLLVRPAQTS